MEQGGAAWPVSIPLLGWARRCALDAARWSSLTCQHPAAGLGWARRCALDGARWSSLICQHPTAGLGKEVCIGCRKVEQLDLSASCCWTGQWGVHWMEQDRAAWSVSIPLLGCRNHVHHCRTTNNNDLIVAVYKQTEVLVSVNSHSFTISWITGEMLRCMDDGDSEWYDVVSHHQKPALYRV